MFYDLPCENYKFDNNRPFAGWLLNVDSLFIVSVLQGDTASEILLLTCKSQNSTSSKVVLTLFIIVILNFVLFASRPNLLISYWIQLSIHGESNNRRLVYNQLYFHLKTVHSMFKMNAAGTFPISFLANIVHCVTGDTAIDDRYKRPWNLQA